MLFRSALAEEGHDDGQQHAQQIAGTLRAQAGGLAQSFGCAGRALVAEDGGEQVAGIAERGAAGRRLAAAQHAAHQPDQDTDQAAAGRVARAAQQAAEDVAQAASLAGS